MSRAFNLVKLATHPKWSPMVRRLTKNDEECLIAFLEGSRDLDGPKYEAACGDWLTEPLLSGAVENPELVKKIALACERDANELEK